MINEIQCRNCKHAVMYKEKEYCGKYQDIDGKLPFISTRDARLSFFFCGPNAKFFKEKTSTVLLEKTRRLLQFCK